MRTKAVNDIAVGVSHYFVSSLIVVIATSFGHAFLIPLQGVNKRNNEPIGAFTRFDGEHYKDICADGYSYDPDERSTVAFFPLYPVLSLFVMEVFRCPPAVGLLIVSNLFLALSCVALHRYARLRYKELSPRLPIFVVAAFVFFPPTLFFHMAYSESLFFFLAVAVLLGMEERWPLWVIGLLVGLATAARPVGVALLPVLALYLWRNADGIKTFLVRSLFILPLGCSGLLAYMAFQWWAFGEPLAFAKTQDHWRAYPRGTAFEQFQALVQFEPIWGVFDPSSARYWGRLDLHEDPLHSMIFLNPVFFCWAVLTIAIGVKAKWLNGYEILLACGLLLIPYVTRAYDNSMLAMARFVAAAVPCYLVWGRMALLLPAFARSFPVAIGVYFLAIFAAMFAAGYWVF